MSVYFKILALLLRGDKPAARKLALRKYVNWLRRYYRYKGHQGFDVMDEEWDYLLILDACRYDYFAEMHEKFLKDGDLQKRISRGTSTSDWLLKTFLGREKMDDIVYVSANPHCSDHEIHGFKGTDYFHAVDHVWKYAWNDTYDTVTPDEVSKAALRMRRKYPRKRMIVHYIQPHGPWIGKTKISVDEIGKDTDFRKKSDINFLSRAGLTNDEGRWTVDSKVWRLVQEGRFDVKLLKQAAKDNLELVLEEVRDLVTELDGKIVVTADHGEAFGEKFVYGHPPKTYTRELVEVPWYIIDKGPRDPSKISAGGETDRPEDEVEDIDDESLKARLRALGYID